MVQESLSHRSMSNLMTGHCECPIWNP
jgi:hypothetical protein